MNLVPRRLASKLILWLTVISGVMAIISSVIHIRTQERQLLDVMIQGADQLSRSITSATWHAMLADHRDDAYQQMRTIATKQGIDRIRIFNKEGRVMFSTGRDDTPRVDKNAEACYLCHSSTEPLVKIDVPTRARIFKAADGSRKLGMVTPIYNEPACSQAACHAHPADMRVLGVLDVTMKLDAVDTLLKELEVRVPLITLFNILLVSVFIYFFTRHFVDRPIRKLIGATRAVSAMQLDQPIEINSSEELDELARSFNSMRVQLMNDMGVINQFTHELESKVEDRTKQLRIAHQKLLQSDRLASLGQLSASVAHEINNPISGVLNLSMLMQRIVKDDGIPAGRVPEFRKYLAQIVAETTRVGRIVSDLLAFSRRSKPQRTRTDLNVLIARTLSLVSHKLKLGNVEVETHLLETLPQVRCDGSQFQQVILNLVMNAAEATAGRGQGKVSITTRLSDDGKSVLLDVTDDGEGIPAANLSRIFDPFFTTKGEGKGTGLGLSVVYGILEEHGGDIEVDSTVGRGTTFRVTPPLCGDPEPVGATAE